MKPLRVNGVEISEDRVRRRLTELEERKERLERDLLTLQRQHLDDWNRFGSALSVERMRKDEEKIADKILRVERDIGLMQDVLNDCNLGMHDLDVVAWDEVKESIDQHIAFTEAHLKEAKKRQDECQQFQVVQQRLRAIIINGVV